MAILTPPPEEWWRLPRRLRRKVEPDPATGCWRWLGALDRDGYPRVRWEGRTQQAHRVVFVLLCGEIPNGYEVDHTCRNRGCCAPGHLEAVPKVVNLARRNSAKVTAPSQLALFAARGSVPAPLREPGWRP
jgi:hypothetical protein